MKSCRARRSSSLTVLHYISIISEKLIDVHDSAVAIQANAVAVQDNAVAIQANAVAIQDRNWHCILNLNSEVSP